jgi:prepilin-type N-terminal cleavage/methylation domain-containing protein
VFVIVKVGKTKVSFFRLYFFGNKKMLKANKGLTLVEVLITSALMAIVIIPLNTMFAQIANSWDVLINKTKSAREARVAADNIISKIKEADSITFEDSNNDEIDDDNKISIAAGSNTYEFYRNNDQLIIKKGSSEEILATDCTEIQFINPGKNNLYLIKFNLQEYGEKTMAISRRLGT